MVWLVKVYDLQSDITHKWMAYSVSKGLRAETTSWIWQFPGLTGYLSAKQIYQLDVDTSG